MSSERRSESETKRDLVITRAFDAPVEDVWRAWTDCKQVMRWWGPRGFSSPSCKVDLREGGKYLFHMRAPESEELGDLAGQDFYNTGVYRTVEPMKCLEFSQVTSDKDGNEVDPAEVGMGPDFPKEVRTSLTFQSVDGKTEMTVREYGWPVGETRDLSEKGWGESLDKLAEALARH